MKHEYLKAVKRIVIKVGTSTLTYPDGTLNNFRIRSLVSDIASLHQMGYEIIFVSSGAVGTGNGKLRIKKNTSLSQKQASAAVGQVLLMKLYEQLFDAHNIMVGQILLTKYDISNRKNNLNAQNTINELLKLKVIPIINENDSTVVEEIKVGDNDNLGGLVAILSDADLYVILSDIDGIYTDNPQKNKDAELLNIIPKIDDEIRSYAKDKGSEFAVGGMLTKLEAAAKVCDAGIHFVIANGSRDHILVDVVQTEFIGSLFVASSNRMVAKKKWLKLASNNKGCIIIDEGAVNALINNNSSLLPIGVVDVLDHFEEGDVISICDKDNNVIAKGITNYSYADISLIKGLKEVEFTKLLNSNYLYKTIVHKDNLVIVKED